MNLLVNVIFFVIVLLFYLNLVQECKIGQDLDVYELDYQNAEQLNKMCQNKQPVVFRMNQGEVIPDSHFINSLSPAILAEKYGKEDVFLSSFHCGQPDEEPIAVPLEKAIMVQHDRLFENNHDFIMDSPIHHYYESIDPHLRPFGTIQTEYDFAFGTDTALRHHQHHSFFVYAVGGDLDVKLTPYKNVVAGKQHPFDGYVYPDFQRNTQTLLNCWADYGEEDEENLDITFLNVSIPKGYCLFIPPYWWYSIRHIDPGQGGWTAVFKYDTIMGKVVHLLGQMRNGLVQTKRNPVEEETGGSETEEHPLLGMDE